MIYSTLYKKHYPFRSSADVFSLSQEEKSCLISYIKRYPARLSEKLHNARKNGIKVEGWEIPKSWKSRVFPSYGLANALAKMQLDLNTLIAKIEKELTLTGNDISNINRILYSNKYCRLLSWFMCPTPDGRVSAALLEP